MGTFILNFQTINFEADAKIALEMLSDYQKLCSLENSFALDPPIQSLGWSFAKMFLAGQLVEEIYGLQADRIDSSKGKKIEDKFISWLQKELKDRGCSAYIKMAPEMKST
ncbi:MAG: hypothetical protein ACJ70Y_02465 [Nitrososphaera sp.]